jgi:quercetin dioxygenase-like cupin family protein
VKTRDVRDLVWFSEEDARTEVLHESSQLFGQVVCLQGSQGVGPTRDAKAEVMVVVLAGQVAAQVGRSRARLGQWETVLVSAGEDLTLRNASDEPSVVLLVLAPPPS